MRKIVLALFVLLFASASCAHAPRGGDFRQTRDSVYKVKVRMKLDLKPLNDWIAKKKEERRKREEEQRKAEEEKKAREEYCAKYGCFGHPSGIMIRDVEMKVTPLQKASGFYVLQQSRDFAEVGWSGTGWVAAKAPGRSYVMTAGHVCESGDVYPIEIWDIDWEAGTFTTVTIELPIVEKHHTLLGRDGTETADTTVIRDEDMDENFNGNDLCMVGIAQDLGPAIPVASTDPEYGESCSVVGAPIGLWGGGIAIPSQLVFAGRGALFGTQPDGLTFNGLVAPGNSGSGVTCDGSVVGVVSFTSAELWNIVQTVPYQAITQFMQKALHQK